MELNEKLVRQFEYSLRLSQDKTNSQNILYLGKCIAFADAVAFQYETDWNTAYNALCNAARHMRQTNKDDEV